MADAGSAPRSERNASRLSCRRARVDWRTRYLALEAAAVPFYELCERIVFVGKVPATADIEAAFDTMKAVLGEDVTP